MRAGLLCLLLWCFCVRFATYLRSIKSIANRTQVAISSPSLAPSILGTGLPAAHVPTHHDLVNRYMCLSWGADCTGRRQRGGTSRVWVGPELSSVFYARKNLLNLSHKKTHNGPDIHGLGQYWSHKNARHLVGKLSSNRVQRWRLIVSLP